MIRNYLALAFRNLLKTPTFSVVNILGLAISIGACILIVQYVSFELSYDKFHRRADDIYRVYLDIANDGNHQTHSARVSPGVATAFRNEFAEIETFTRMVILGPDGVLTYENNFTAESDIYLADTAFFDVFDFRLLRGNPLTAFQDPFSVVITSTTAQTLFGDEDPIGKSIVINAKNFDGTSLPFKVTGVVEDFPVNSHMHPGVLISYPTLFEFVGHRFDDSWTWNETYTYMRLHEHADSKKLETQFAALVNRLNPQLREEGSEWRYKLQNIGDIHLHSDLEHEMAVNGNAGYIYLLVSVGILLLLIAYINFVNLVTVRCMQRSREVGVRKVSGAYRRQLVAQFLIESLLLNAIAMVVAVALANATGPLIEESFGITLATELLGQPVTLPAFSGFLLLLVLGSGLYPAAILSRFKPVEALKAGYSGGNAGNTVRKIAVTIQFTAAIVLIALTLAAHTQVRYMQQQTLGFSPEQVVVLRSPKAHDYGYGTNFSGFKNRVGQLAHVSSVSASNVVPGQEVYWYDDQVTLNGSQTSGVFSMLGVAPNYFSHYDIPLLAGRRFTDAPGDQETWIINESAMRLLGFEHADEVPGEKLNGREIIGVVKDFHHESLQTAIPPVLFNAATNFNYYSVRLETDELAETLSAIREAYATLFPGSPFEYFFLDEFFDRQYKADRAFNNLFSTFSLLGILVACMGLFGLSWYVTSRRSKEIGIRKVMGASVIDMVALLTRDFIKLVLIAGFLAIPLAYLVTESWLNNYAFRIGVTWWLLVAPVAIILLLSFATVSIQTVRTALVNPSLCLRHE